MYQTINIGEDAIVTTNSEKDSIIIIKNMDNIILLSKEEVDKLINAIKVFEMFA